MAVKCVMLEHLESLTVLRDSLFLHKCLQLFKHESNIKTRCLTLVARNQNETISPRPQHFLFLVTQPALFYDLQGHRLKSCK